MLLQIPNILTFYVAIIISISASDSNFNPRNTQCIPAVKIFALLDLNKKS